MTSKDDIIRELKSLANPCAVEGMARFGISPRNTLGVSVSVLRKIAKRVGTDHELADSLWATDIHEAQILAALIDDPKLVTEKQMGKWANDFDSWDVCDVCCNALFGKTEFAYRKAFEWSRREAEFVKRAGFVMMAVLAVHDKEADDSRFTRFLPTIFRAANDERNYVKKSVNWALRQIGKRNPALNKRAIRTAMDIRKRGTKSANWIAADALRELNSAAVQKMLRSKGKRA